MRNYSAGELVGRPTTTSQQLANSANFVSDGRLYLVRCMACGDPERGRENYLPAASSGRCVWCGWSEEPESELP